MKPDDKRTFATFFPGCENTHLIKDVGMIPYVLGREFGYDAYVISYRNDTYSHLESSVKGLKMLFLERSFLAPAEDVFIRGDDWTGFPAGRLREWYKLFFTTLDLARLLRKHAKRIDTFQVYHFRYESIVAGLLYRLFNRRGILYMKLDMNPGTLEQYRRDPRPLKRKLRVSYLLYRLARFDLVSAESEELCRFLEDNHPLFRRSGVLFLRNGIDIGAMPPASGFDRKEDVVLHVARMGFPDKASENAIEAFGGAAGAFPGWKLVLAGKMTPEFAARYERFLAANPGLRDRIAYVGHIDDREAMYRLYDRAKVLLVPSRRESFGIAAVEGGYFGDVIAGSDIPALQAVTDGGRLGYLCPVDDVPALAGTLRRLMAGEGDLRGRSAGMSRFIAAGYDWSRICDRLARAIAAIGDDGGRRAAKGITKATRLNPVETEDTRK